LFGKFWDIRIEFKKETVELAKEETLIVVKKIKNLETTVVSLQKQKNVVYVSHNIALTMIDGKICDAITSTSSAQVCYVCGAASKQMNRIVKSLKYTSTYRPTDSG
jgi:hypothetical protein